MCFIVDSYPVSPNCSWSIQDIRTALCPQFCSRLLFILKTILNSDNKIGLILRSSSINTTMRYFGNHEWTYLFSFTIENRSLLPLLRLIFFFHIDWISTSVCFMCMAATVVSRAPDTRPMCLARPLSSFPLFFILFSMHSMRGTYRPFVFETTEFGRTTRNRSCITRRYCHKRVAEMCIRYTYIAYICTCRYF